MIPEIGHFALILALTMALSQALLPLAGAHNGNAAWMALGRASARGQLLFVALAFGCLTAAFVGNDFSVLYVAQHSNSQLPLHYRIAAVWGGHEGSILLWILMLAGWTFAVAQFSKHLDERMVARILGIMGLISVGFLLFTLLTSNPFQRLLPAAAEGQDLNPLLQDPGMVIHPPMLYMGYVGTVVAFAFAIAALLSGRLDAAWARWSRPWTTVAWCFLTVGIALGSAWAYYELGWGGWWFWDPVENASLMPWLACTALMHSLAVTEKRGGFKMWTALLAIIVFSLSLLGTFLVRSGVLSSVHAFATDPARGVFILGFLAVVVGGSLLLFAWRAPKVGAGGTFEAVSRESMLLANNVLLLVAAAAVLLGTLYPLVLDALNMGKISVGPPYFQAVFVPLVAPALFLMGIGPIARWRSAGAIDLAKRLKWALAVSAIAAVVAPLAMGRWTPMIGFGLLLAAWIVASAVTAVVERVRANADRGVWRQLAAQPGSWYGMLLAHGGIAVFIVGVTLVNGYQVEKDVRMEPGDTTTVGGYTFRFDGVSQQRGPNYNAARGTITVTSGDRAVTTLLPEKRIYTASRMPMTEAAIHTGVTRDLYVAMGEPVSDTAWGVRVYYKPFVDWIWGGCLLMALGGFLAVLDRRYRTRRTLGRQPAPALTAGAPTHGAALPAGAGRNVRDPRRHGSSRRRRRQPPGRAVRPMKRYLLPLVVFIGLVAFLAVGLNRDPREVPSPLIDKPAPTFNLPRLDAPQQTLSLADLRGQVWLLNVWASWCVACRQEHPLLVDLAKTNVVPVYGLNYKDKRDAALGWLAQWGNPYTQSMSDADGLVGIDYGVYGVPETFVIDQAGVIRHKQIGPVTPETLRDTILPLVRKLQEVGAGA